MITRRALLAAVPAAIATGAAARPQLAFAGGVSDGVTFRRAYSACAESGLKSLLTGVFPHSYRGQEPPPLTRFFDVTRTPGDAAIVIVAGLPRAGWRDDEARFALTIRLPGKLVGGITTDVLLSSVDVLPTVMALAGLEIPEGIHGKPVSLDAPPASIYAEGRLGETDEWRMIVRGYDKMVTTAKLEPKHLFNLADDPSEASDLALEPGHRLRVDELRALMFDWRKRTADGVDRSGLKRRK